MADAIVSVVAEHVTAIIEEQIRRQVNLVRGVEKELQNLSRELNTVRNVLDDAEKKGYKDKSVKDWLRRLEDTAYEMDDVLDEWNVAILKHELEQSNASVVPPKKNKVHACFSSSSCLCFKKVAIRRDIAKKIENVKAKLDLILAEKDRYGFEITSQPNDPSHESWRAQSTSLIDFEEVCGRNFERENLVTKLVPEGGSGEQLGIHVLSIVGVGGIGKTTLAKLAYNDSRVEKYYELRIWICVSDPFDEVGIANGIIEGAGGSKPNSNQLDMLLQHLKETIQGRKFLLVLDDVWAEDDTKWEPLRTTLKYGGPGSKILVTTRKTRAAIMMGTLENDIHRLGELSNEECWSLLGRIALSRKNEEDCVEFENVGKKIAKKCKGLPLAAKTLGSLLRFKNSLEEWENVLNSEIWDLEEVEVELFPHLLLSYNELSPTLKRCFSYCAVFPKDSRIEVERLITKWMTLGYLELSNGSTAGDWQLRGREYFDKLAMRSLFQDFEKVGGDLKDEQIKTFKMHDILHDFAQFLRKSGGVRVGTKKEICRICGPLLVSRVEEYRSLFCFKQPPPDLCDCLRCLRLLSLRDCGLQSIPKEIEKLIHLRWLDLGSNRCLGEEDLKTVCELYNLQFLWIDRCGLQEVSREIGNLIHLKQLDLSSNKLLKELPESLFGLHELQILNISCCGFQEVPTEIGNLFRLKQLDLSSNKLLKELPESLCSLHELEVLNINFCDLQEVPREIGNLIHLKQLDLSYNGHLKELPESLCDIHRLESLNIDSCGSLSKLPQGIQRLINLKHLDTTATHSLKQFPQGVAQLTSLRTLSQFPVGRYWSKLRWLKNLNRLSGSLALMVQLTADPEELVEDAREAELKKKMHIQELRIYFSGWMHKEEERLDVIDALEPHPNLKYLMVRAYWGSQLPRWIYSPLNQLRSVKLICCELLLSLPPLGKLPFLEVLEMQAMIGLQFVGREFLGITTRGDHHMHIGAEASSSSFSSNTSSISIGFPKLETLRFYNCPAWKEWEDIAAEEEDSRTLSLMPCLTTLSIHRCPGLTRLPHRLLRKALSLKVLDVSDSNQLQQLYSDKDGEAWKSISHHNQHLRPPRTSEDLINFEALIGSLEGPLCKNYENDSLV